MPPRPRPSLPTRAAIVFGAAAVLSVTPLRAQQTPAATETRSTPPPAESFAFEIGHAARAGGAYAVFATQPATSKLTGQKIRLKAVTTTGFDRTTHYFTLATGKHKTVAEIDAVLVDIFRRFLANPAPASAQEIGKIGDVQHGGEVRFVVASANSLRFDHISPDQPPHVSNFSRDDVAGLLAALTGQPPI